MTVFGQWTKAFVGIAALVVFACTLGGIAHAQTTPTTVCASVCQAEQYQAQHPNAPQANTESPATTADLKACATSLHKQRPDFSKAVLADACSCIVTDAYADLRLPDTKRIPWNHLSKSQAKRLKQDAFNCGQQAALTHRTPRRQVSGSSSSSSIPGAKQLRGAPTTAPVNGALLGSTQAGQPVGSIQVELLSTQQLATLPNFGTDLPPIQPPPGSVFFAVRYKVTNNTNVDIDPGVDVAETGNTVAVDAAGRSWTNHYGVDVGGLASSRGDASPDDSVGPGLSATTWIVFAVPPSAQPLGLAIPVSSGSPEYRSGNPRYTVIRFP
jgi:hypothetical protein